MNGQGICDHKGTLLIYKKHLITKGSVDSWAVHDVNCNMQLQLLLNDAATIAQ